MSDEAAIQYRIHVAPVQDEAAHSVIIASLQEKIPNLAKFIETNLGSSEVSEIPKSFNLEQALRLQEILHSAGLETELISSVEAPPPQQLPAVPPRNEMQQMSSFLWMGILPEGTTGSWVAKALAIRIVAGFLAVPGAVWVFGSVAVHEPLPIVASVVSAMFLDSLVLWVGLRIFAPSGASQALKIEALISPLYFLDVVPILGTAIGATWRFMARIHGARESAPEQKFAIWAPIFPYALLMIVLAALLFALFAGGTNISTMQFS